jgi:hypothetical protein
VDYPQWGKSTTIQKSQTRISEIPKKEGKEMTGWYPQGIEELRSEFPTDCPITHKKKCNSCRFFDCKIRKEDTQFKQPCIVIETLDFIPIKNCGEGDELCYQCPDPTEKGCEVIGPAKWVRLTKNPFKFAPDTIFCKHCDNEGFIKTFKQKGGLTRHINAKHPEKAVKKPTKKARKRPAKKKMKKTKKVSIKPAHKKSVKRKGIQRTLTDFSK